MFGISRVSYAEIASKGANGRVMFWFSMVVVPLFKVSVKGKCFSAGLKVMNDNYLIVSLLIKFSNFE